MEKLIENLRAVGVEIEVRIDPIIPFRSGDPPSIRSLLGAIAERGVRRATLSYLHLRPAIFEQLKHELPPAEFALLRGFSLFGRWLKRQAAGNGFGC